MTMKEKHTQQKRIEASFDEVLMELAALPEGEEIERGFAQLMAVVTNQETQRIPYVSPQETRLISLLYMTTFQKLIGAAAAAFVVVLAVGYFTIYKNNSNNYDDIVGAAVEDPSSYQVADNQDSFSDLNEQDPAASSSILGDTAESAPLGGSATSIDATLSDLDALFANDDINDADLQTWSEDTSAGDPLIQDYTI